MFKFIFKRSLEAIPVLLAITCITFFMARLAPGDPFSSEKDMPEEVHKRLMDKYGLNDPLPTQFFRYLGVMPEAESKEHSGLLQGDFGPSFGHPTWDVNELIADRVWISVELGFWALLIAIFIGLSAGIIAGIKPNSLTDYAPMTVAMAGICLPTFVMGPILILILGLHLEWFPIWGWILPQDRILPALTLGLFYAAYFARISRASVVEIRNQDYIRTATAKGLPPWRIYLIHNLRNALSPVISFMGPAAAGLISGSFIIETIFQIPGLGKLFVESALNHDYNLLLGLTIFYAALIILFNLLVDICIVLLNPKLAFEK